MTHRYVDDFKRLGRIILRTAFYAVAILCLYTVIAIAVSLAMTASRTYTADGAVLLSVIITGGVIALVVRHAIHHPAPQRPADNLQEKGHSAR